MKTFINKAKFSKIEKYLLVKSKRPRVYDNYSVFNAILFVLVTGCQWRNLCNKYPPYRTVFHHFCKWKSSKVFHRILSSLNSKIKPRILIIDNQSISDSDMPTSKRKGYDGHKKRKGRKRCILADIKGNIQCQQYLPANTSEVDTAYSIIQRYKLTPFGKSNKQQIYLLADKGFHSPKLEQYCKRFKILLLAIPRLKKPDLTTKVGQDIFKQQYGYKLNLIKSLRWIVERTFAWLQKYRRLNMNYERTISSLDAMTLLASIRIRLRSD
jgi:putative transposase